jgi:hypothetical protein
MTPALGIQFDETWRDEDLIMVHVTAWNGRFGGSAEVYVPTSDLTKHASRLKGFPSSVSDSRTIELGTFDPSCAGGGLRLRFYCLDGAGHTFVECKVRPDSKIAGVEQHAVIALPIEPAAVDSFVEQMARLDDLQTKTATLAGKRLAND